MFFCFTAAISNKLLANSDDLLASEMSDKPNPRFAASATAPTASPAPRPT